MTAYSSTELYNLFVNKQGREALERRYISPASYRAILQQHPVSLYSPNVFVQVGLFILTLFIVSAASGLLLMIFHVNRNFGFFIVFLGLCCYGVLEMIAGSKKHYNSGVDNMLLAAVPIFIVSGIGMETNNAERLLCFLSFTICGWLAYRFADSLMAIAAAVSGSLFVLYLYVNLGEFTISSFPFVLITASAALYVLCRYALNNTQPVPYKSCWEAVEIISLVGLYGFGNVYVVEMLTQDIFLLLKNSPMNISWFFWSWTFLIPVLYFVRGLKKQALLLIRLGFISFALSIITFRHYHSIISIEVALMIAGAVCIIVSSLLFRYLSAPKHGFVFVEDEHTEQGVEDLKAYAVGEGFARQPLPEEPRFGGGSFGGGGAGSNY